ncbi:hypothetical protein DFH28DRAFT_288737 [Melampsora americana]|nr:hypothetical protein DFH28DRAFT_288737 [Melampsora americana]
MKGPWLSLLPVTDSTSSSSSNTTSHHPIHFKSNSRITSHTHDHHPTSNSILKPIILERRPKLKKTIHTHSISTHPHSSNQPHLINSGSSDSNLTLKSSTLLYHQSHHHQQQQQDDHKRFEIRNLKVTDLEKVKELHHSTLPITYPTSFFCNLLMREENEIALVATLPSSLPPGYFDLKLQCNGVEH